jgi:hypothetical protein
MLEDRLVGGRNWMYWVGYDVGVGTWPSEVLPLAIAIVVIDSRLLVFG